MGIWEWIGSTTEAVKRNAPDAAPVRNACSYGGAAFTNTVNGLYKLSQLKPNDETKSKIGTYTTKFAKDSLHKVNDLYRSGNLMLDDEKKSKISSYATIFAKNAGHYAIQDGYQLIPGGAAFANIVSKTMDDVKHENLKLKDKDVGSVEKHGNSHRDVGSVADDKWGSKSPEEVIRAFMMKDLFVNWFLDGVMVSEIARKKGKKPE